LAKAPEFDPIEEMKDPKFEEMTMSKIDSDHVASEVVAANKENTSLIINNQKYVEVPMNGSAPPQNTSPTNITE
jgi:hypothetical protein